MGCLIRWQAPTSGSSWTSTKVFASSSESGSYSEIADISIGTYSYYHRQGTSSSWYKVKYYDSINVIESAFSNILQGSNDLGYCSIDDIRKLSDITSSELDDSGLYDVITYATKLLNRDVQIYIEDEHISYINGEKENLVNGTNTVFYTKNVFIGDANDDGEINPNGVYAYTIDADGTRATATISSIDDARIGKFTLSSAPASTTTLYITYPYAPVNMQTSGLVKMACIYLTAALTSTKLDAGQMRTFRVGKTYVSREVSKFTDYMNKYLKLLDRIRAGNDMVGDTTEDVV